MWAKAKRELLVEGARVRHVFGEEGIVMGYARGQIYVDFGIGHGAFWTGSIAKKEHETLEVWVEE